MYWKETVAPETAVLPLTRVADISTVASVLADWRNIDCLNRTCPGRHIDCVPTGGLRSALASYPSLTLDAVQEGSDVVDDDAIDEAVAQVLGQVGDGLHRL